jgi:phospholipase D1/2
VGLGALVLLLGGLAAAWALTPLGDLLKDGAVLRWADAWRGEAWAGPAVVLAFCVGGLLVIPVTVLILATVTVFGGWVGGLYALLGALASGVLVFWVGRLLGREGVDRLLSGRARRLRTRLTDRGVVAVLLVRLVPAAPYSVANVVLGASGLRFVHFAVGSALGLLPSIVALSLLGEGLLEVVSRGAWSDFALLLGGLALLLGVSIGARRLWARFASDGSEAPQKAAEARWSSRPLPAGARRARSSEPEAGR